MGNRSAAFSLPNERAAGFDASGSALLCLHTEGAEWRRVPAGSLGAAPQPRALYQGTAFRTRFCCYFTAVRAQVQAGGRGGLRGQPGLVGAVALPLREWGKRSEYVTCVAVRAECLGRRQFAFIRPPAPVQFHELPSLVHDSRLPQSSSASRFTAGRHSGDTTRPSRIKR
jgi:hypothetical protein